MVSRSKLLHNHAIRISLRKLPSTNSPNQCKQFRAFQHSCAFGEFRWHCTQFDAEHHCSTLAERPKPLCSNVCRGSLPVTVANVNQRLTRGDSPSSERQAEPARQVGFWLTRCSKTRNAQRANMPSELRRWYAGARMASARAVAANRLRVLFALVRHVIEVDQLQGASQQRCLSNALMQLLVPRIALHGRRIGSPWRANWVSRNSAGNEL